MPSRLADISQTTLGELIELAVEKELVEFCYLARSVVVISIGGHQLSYPPEEARSFLRTLMQGWSRARAPHEKEAHPMEALRGTLFPTGAGPSGQKQPEAARPPGPTGSASPTEVEAKSSAAGMRAGRSGVISSSEDYIDAVLSFAEEMRLIEGFDKDERTGRVTLHTQATTTEMTYFETLEYLTNSILHELRAAPPS